MAELDGVRLEQDELPFVLAALDLLARRLRADGQHRHLPRVDQVSRRIGEQIVARVPPMAPSGSTSAPSAVWNGLPTRVAADLAGVKRERMVALAREGKVVSDLVDGRRLIDERSLRRWMDSRNMRRPAENRVPVDDGPDPRNVSAITKWHAGRQAPRSVTKNWEEREAFIPETWESLEDVNRGRSLEWWDDPGVATVGEVRRGKLRDVRVVLPRDVYGVHGFRTHMRGEVVDWATAVANEIVIGRPAGWSTWEGVA